MNGRERVLATVRGESVDKIPVYHLQFSGDTASIILGRPDVHVGGEHLQWLEIKALWKGADAHARFEERCETDAVDIAEALGHDMLRLRYWRWPQNHRPVEKLDEMAFLMEGPDGVRYTVFYEHEIELLTRVEGRGRGGRPLGRVERQSIDMGADDLRRLTEEERAAARKGEPKDYRWLADVIRRYEKFAIRHGGDTVFVNMYSVAELMAVAEWPELFADLLMARAQRIAVEIPAMAKAGLDIIFSGMDFCTNRGPSISPETFRDVVMPALKLLVDTSHENGMYYFYTSDGNIWSVAEYMFDGAGVDGWAETDKSAGMELRPLRERFPKVTFQGNIRSQLLHRGSRDEVIRETMEALEVAHELGGVLLGVSNLIMPGTPAENITALMETIEANR